tara:strand:+ start:124552 stop:125802 length:1251 start_codon:yes stop_codon:yes gene_type:complete
MFSLFAPPFYDRLGSAGVLAIIVCTIMLCWLSISFFLRGTLPLNTTERKAIFGVFAAYFIYFLLLPVSSIIGFIFNDFSITIRDLSDIYRPVLYASVFLLTFYSFNSKESFISLEKGLLIVFTGFVLLSVAHLVGFFDPLIAWFTKAHNVKSRRVCAPFINPYDYAFVMSFYIYYFFLKFLYKSWKFIFLLLLALLMFVSTQSRSIAVGMLFGLVIITPAMMVLVNFRSLREFKLPKTLIKYNLLLVLSIIFFIASVGYLIENYQYLTYEFVKIWNNRGQEISAGSTRLEQLNMAIEYATASPLNFFFGNGPAKDVMEYVESIYTFFFFRYGVVGLFTIFIIPYLIALYSLIKILRKLSPAHPLFVFFLAAVIWLLALPVCAIGNNLTEQFRTSFLYNAFLAIVIRGRLLFTSNET